MVRRGTIAVLGLVLAGGALAAAAPVVAAVSATPAGHARDGTRRARVATAPAPATNTRGGSGELWATVDICNSASHPDTIGIRGSMPGDGHAHDTMYMRFLVQSQDLTTDKWADIGKSADSGYVQVGSAAVTRQAGFSFEFKPTTSAYTLRGLVEFVWHHAGRTVRTASRPTTGGHTSVAGAEPKGFSAASCTLK
jgi:hypothetical protein